MVLERGLFAADLGRQLGDLELGPGHGAARSRVRLPLEHRPELAVELGSGAQEPVAQLLELWLSKQEVLADPGVERPDGVDGQIVTSPDLLVGRPKSGVGPAYLVMGGRQVGI